MSDHLLLTKLYVPSSKPTLVARPRLVEQVNAGLQSGCKLTLVSAPAGFGKTTLVTEWLSQIRESSSQLTGDDSCAAWLSLDEGDNDPSRFLTYFVAALQKLDSRIGDAAAMMLHSPQPPQTESVLTSLLNDIVELERSGRSEHPSVLVLDDYHLIAAPAIHTAVTFLLENLPRNLHLVILGRSDPLLPLSRFRVRGQISEIRQADLRFTTNEAALFLNHVMGLSLSTGQVETLEARTEGWIAGLQLAALSMRDRDDVAEFVETFSGSHRFVMDYLAEEVIQGQPDDSQQFILQTSILSRLSASLCEAVTGQDGGQETLEKLEESNLFLIPLDDNRVWFRYHHLFADVMANRLQRFSPGQVPELHLRAATWFQQNNLSTDAIEHALAANAYEFAADLVEGKATELLRAGSVSTLLSWLHKLPPETVNERPTLSVFSAWVYLLIGKQEKIEDHLSTAEKSLPSGEDVNSLRGNIAAIRAYAAARQGDFNGAIDQAHQALKLLPSDDFPNRAVVSFVLGGVYYMQQDIPRALASMKEASQLGERAGNFHVAVQALSSRGGILLRQGKLAQAEKAFNQALRLGCGSSGQPLPFTASAHVGLAELCLAQRDLIGARQFAEKALELGEKWVNVESQAAGYLALAQIEKSEGHPDEAQAALKKARHLAATHQLTPDLEEEIAAFERAFSAIPPGEVDLALPDRLSEHELKVLRLIAAGLSNREVAEALYLSVNTVKWHLKNTYEKLDVHSRVAAVTRAQELGLL